MSKVSALEQLAIDGGEPVKKTPYGSQSRYGEEELQELREALEQGTLFYAQGKKVRQLEEDFARMVGARFAVATSSGTASIHAAMTAVGISPGDEVILTPITDMGSLVPVLFQGGVPVFADLDPHTYNLQPESVEARITPATRAVLAVHLAGNACDMKALKSICAKHNLLLIEDCAQAFGSEYDGKPVGTHGLVGCFSLNEFKHISCGDGGIVVTDDPAIASRLRLATDKCYNREPGAAMRNPVFLAANYRMTELQGAVSVAQLRKLDSIVSRRRTYADGLNAGLAGVPGITLPKVTPNSRCSWWFYMFRVVPEVLGIDADRFSQALSAEGVPAGAHYIGRPVYEYPVFADHSAFERGTHPYAARQYGAGLCPTAEAILETCVRLSCHEAFTPGDLDDSVRAVRKVATWFSSKR
jgi:perosamine synthetase